MPKDNNIDTCIKSPDERQHELIPEMVGVAMKTAGSVLDGIEGMGSRPIIDSNTIEDGLKFAAKAGEKTAVMNEEERKCLEDREINSIKNSIFDFSWRSFLNMGLLAAQNLVSRVEELPELTTSQSPQMQQFMENLEQYNMQTHLKSVDAMPKIESPPVFEAKPEPFVTVYKQGTMAYALEYNRVVNERAKRGLCYITTWEYDAIISQNLNPVEPGALRNVESSVLCPHGGRQNSQGAGYNGGAGGGSSSTSDGPDGCGSSYNHGIDVGICLKDADGYFTDCLNDRNGHHTGPR